MERTYNKVESRVYTVVVLHHNQSHVQPLKTKNMERISLAGLIAMLGILTILWGKPWVTPNDPGPVNTPPAIEGSYNHSAVLNSPLPE